MKIAIFGAGSIGCLVGGSLLAKGNDVVFIGKERIAGEIEKHGLTISDLENRVTHLPKESIKYSVTPDAIAGADVILLCVKCTHTREAAKEIAIYANKNAIIYSLQNGVGNTAILREELKGFDVVAAMVGFNAVQLENNRFHRATDAGLVLGKNVASHELARLLRNAHIPASISNNMQEVLWGKLCLNLNNALNVLSDLPLKQQLENRSYRKILGICISEALEVMTAKGITPEKIGKVKPKYLPFILNLPDPIFSLAARSMMKMDDEARSSMWEDLQKRREPEIDYLNGAIVKAGEENMVATPANRIICALVKEAFAAGSSPRLSGEQLLSKIENLDSAKA
ncbi:MAG: 2-dehydropantoate 2-reductase [Salaquimonas sp.]